MTNAPAEQQPGRPLAAKNSGSASAGKLAQADAASCERTAPAQPVGGSGPRYVGWVDSEIAGHKFHCAAHGKYRYRAHNKRYYCCEDALAAADLCAEGGSLGLRRNPHNHYDSNAVQVLGADGCLLGHLPRDMASRLAPLMDSGKVQVRGDGFAVGRGSHGDPFTLLVHADEAWFQGRPPGDKLALQWASFRRCLDRQMPPEGEEGGCFRFPRC